MKGQKMGVERARLENEIKSSLINDMYKEMIDKSGIDKFLKDARRSIKKASVEKIKTSYDTLKKDLKLAPITGGKDEGTMSVLDTINGNKNDIPIFEIEDDEMEYKVKFPLIPFQKFYIATNICERIGNELYTIGGFFVLDHHDDYLHVMFYWSRTPSDGWAFSSFLHNKRGLLKHENKVKVDFNSGDLFGKHHEEHEEIIQMACDRFQNLMKKLIYKITKKEYTTYKKYTYGNYTEKKITFAYDVQTHKRHFWEDSGKFKIPLMSKEEIISKGYGIDELVLKDNQLRTNVPFKVIGEFRVGEVKKEEHKVYDMIEKRHFRQEEKLYKILRELFPNEYIKRHDRKELKGLELDFFVIKKRLAFEYDGEQHFDRKLCEEVFKSDFDALQKRDKRKDYLCRNKRITLIRIKYDEPLNKRYIKKKCKEFL